MMKRLLLLALLLPFVASAQTPIPVANPSFEAAGGWVFSSGAGTWAPSSGVYSAAIPDGKVIGYANSGQSITQDLGVAAMASSTYTLQVWAGHRLDGYATTATIQLFAGAVSLCSQTVDSSTITAGTFAQRTLSCPTTSTPPTGNLKISIVSSGTQTDVDNVTLTVQPTMPPPFVWVMPGLGTATFPMQIPPACGPSDGVCSIQIQVCDTSKSPPVCMISSQGTITLLKNITLPAPQQQAIPLVTVTP